MEIIALRVRNVRRDTALMGRDALPKTELACQATTAITTTTAAARPATVPKALIGSVSARVGRNWIGKKARPERVTEMD